MKKLDVITAYFKNQAGKSWAPEFSAEVMESLNKLTNPDRRALRARLFNEAKILQHKNPDFDTLDWLQFCFFQIDKYTFRLHEVYFSPGTDILDNLRELLYQAKETMDLCVFSITDERLAKAIENALKRNVQIRIVTDDMKTNDTGSKIRSLRNMGIKIKIDHSRFHMHNKFGIIDNRIVFTGSFNWTKTATRANQENLLVTTNHSIVTKYHEEFERLWEEMYKF